jgi:enamine deaminase RidA (YjgF/YER057c/UK114 family)
VKAERYGEGSAFEEAAAYSRAVRRHDHVFVSGTASLGPDGVLFPGDAYGQSREAIRRALDAAERLGAGVADVVKTRLLLAPGCEWEGAIRAHQEAFAGFEPANTTYFVGGFVPPGVLVEVEVEALVDAPPR